MASEHSSSVLDMTEECEQNDVTLPLILEDGCDIAVKVDAPLKQLSRLETYVSYRVRTVCSRWPTPDHVRRRYNHFKVLHKRLVAAHPLLPVPPLPPLHSARQQLDRYGAHFVAVRAMALDCMLNRIAKHPILSHSDDFRIFVTTPDDDIDKELKQQTNWTIGSVYTPELKNTAVRVKDPEFSSALDYLESLQQKLTTLCSITNKLCKYQNATAAQYEGLRACLTNWNERTASGCAKGCTSTKPTSTVYTKCEAVLPTLSNYTSVLAEKIKDRDHLHAAYVAGNNCNNSLHNRLEQASEALRSELQDWNQKTKSEIKQLLLELADTQISIHEKSVRSWEEGLRITQSRPEDIFKTVSKNCVQNLSPTKYKADTPTDCDIDVLSINSNVDSNDLSVSQLGEENPTHNSNDSKDTSHNFVASSNLQRNLTTNETEVPNSEEGSDNFEQNLTSNEESANFEVEKNYLTTDNDMNKNTNTHSSIERNESQNENSNSTVNGIVNFDTCQKGPLEMAGNRPSDNKDISSADETTSEKVLDPLSEFSEVDLNEL